MYAQYLFTHWIGIQIFYTKKKNKNQGGKKKKKELHFVYYSLMSLFMDILLYQRLAAWAHRSRLMQILSGLAKLNLDFRNNFLLK